VKDGNGNVLDGRLPNGLIQGMDSNLYGTAEQGGDSDWDGTIFQITTNGAFTILYTFTGGSDGSGPFAGLVQGTDGFLYGTTDGGGDFTNGTAFKIDTSGNLTTLVEFNETNGAFPEAPLVQGRDGNFYGTTSSGGTNDNGTLFQMTPAGVLTTLWTFTAGNDGAHPGAGLLPDGNGVFYGAAPYAGIGGYGTLFRLDMTPALQTPSQSGSTLGLGWTAVTGLKYQIQFKTNLAQSAWANLGGPITATNSITWASDSIGSDQCIYRVALLP